MAEFAVTVETIQIHPHPAADALEIAQVRGYQAIVRKGQFATGELVAYIPEQAILPTSLIDALGLTGRLAGAEGNRVKAVRLRGVLSQGLCVPCRPHWKAGDDVTEELGVSKYVPPIPTHMSGQVWAAGPARCLKYDIENVKRYPDVLRDGEPVVFTEKVHGTWLGLGLLPYEDADPHHGDLVVTSKGLSDKGLAFQLAANAQNLYVRAARKLLAGPLGDHAALAELGLARPLFVLGEVFGAGVQDLGYGASAAQDASLGVRIFDLYTGTPGSGRYLDDAELDAACAALGLEHVPVLYRGPFSQAVMLEHTMGRETLSGQAMHIREGIVVRPRVERRDEALGRVILKSINPDYLLRKGGTEYT